MRADPPADLFRLEVEHYWTTEFPAKRQAIDNHFAGLGRFDSSVRIHRVLEAMLQDLRQLGGRRIALEDEAVKGAGIRLGRGRVATLEAELSQFVVAFGERVEAWLRQTFQAHPWRREPDPSLVEELRRAQAETQERARAALALLAQQTKVPMWRRIARPVPALAAVVALVAAVVTIIVNFQGALAVLSRLLRRLGILP